MRDGQMENMLETENDAIAMDELLRDMKEIQVQKRVFSSFNMSHGRSKCHGLDAAEVVIFFYDQNNGKVTFQTKTIRNHYLFQDQRRFPK